MMEKRTILAILLCLAIWLVWQALFLETPPPPPIEAEPEKQIEAQAEVKKEVAPREAERPAEKIAVLETNLYRTEISSRGAALRSVILKDYRARDEHKGVLNREEDLVSSKEE